MYMHDDEIALVQKTLAGHKQAFDMLVQNTTNRVFRIIRRFFHDRHVVEDIAQDVYVNAYTRLHTYSQDRPFGNWVAAIAVRECYRVLKEQKYDRHIPESDLGNEGAGLLDAYCFEQPGMSLPDHEKRLFYEETAKKIMARLTPKEQMILTLVEVEGLSMKEVSSLMSISVVNVKVSSFRARKKALKAFHALRSGVRCKQSSEGYAYE